MTTLPSAQRRSSRWRWPRAAVAGSSLTVLAGLGVMLVGSIAYGDWVLIRRPWADLGMGLVVVGLLVAAPAAVALVVSEPLGRWRLAALPGVALTAFEWIVLSVFGLATSGACCGPRPDVSLPSWFYSAPGLIPLVAGSTALILLPFPLAWLAGRLRP